MGAIVRKKGFLPISTVDSIIQETVCLCGKYVCAVVTFIVSGNRQWLVLCVQRFGEDGAGSSHSSYGIVGEVECRRINV